MGWFPTTHLIGIQHINTVDGRNSAPVEVGRCSNYLQGGFQKHPNGRWLESDSTLPSVHESTMQQRSCLGLRLDQNILVNNGLPQWQVGSVAKTRGQVGLNNSLEPGERKHFCVLWFFGNGPDVNSFVDFRICWEVKENPKTWDLHLLAEM